METTTEQTSGSGGRVGQVSISHLFRTPDASDGAAINELIARCPPLDTNSLYCNLLQTTHFAETCAVVERNGKLVGWVSGYIRPDQPRTLFIWQVAVAPEARGLGLGGSMIREILSREICRGVDTIHTTVTASNAPSRALFHQLAKDLNAELAESKCFDRDKDLGGKHPSEFLLEIAPVSGRSGRSGR